MLIALWTVYTWAAAIWAEGWGPPSENAFYQSYFWPILRIGLITDVEEIDSLPGSAAAARDDAAYNANTVLLGLVSHLVQEHKVRRSAAFATQIVNCM